ncbi:hypothetical protein BXU11_08675 [Flavobacterium sp. LM5]|uniref:hypothetical protein n=1 Tax=Flavobacterium sp. LM5 TaxID=1938610 RepID=UPI00099364C4|nr:hypothetical protein [Flavobacterium sp. LM5]OOV27538.1 hypothetical protein BXU11_08675 [Flavobacterium sp. LM5]
MENNKSLNSFQCFVSNSSAKSNNNSSSTSLLLNQKKLIREINFLEKSVVELQKEREKLNLQLLHEKNNYSNSNQFSKNDVQEGLEEIMFIISHKIRLPLTNILGLTNLLSTEHNVDVDNLEIVELIKKSAADLDTFTRELTFFIKTMHRRKKMDLSK